ncbi:hypothetical protein AB6A40_002357 [Gnathostoma spinigerum]|uniref:GRIP domain-containing protein n=1 Tax=Gnathostoma spinigerum TaxID=75299 RepID=A0ABD6E6I5_9BILA
MLRGSEKCSRTDPLLRENEEQKKQIQYYEKKLKDVVRAYKSLSAEKDALQTANEILAGGVPENAARKSKSDTEISSLSDGNSEVSKDAKNFETLKRAFGTLTAERNRREAALQGDKKALLAENEQLRERLSKTARETELQAEKLEQHTKDLRAKIKRIEADREKELADNGAILNELQQKYAKERSSKESLERQIAELYKKLQERDESQNLKEKISKLNNELAESQKEIKHWREKAEKTPTIRVLESQLQNLEERSNKELEELKLQMSTRNSDDRLSRLAELEERLSALTTQMGTCEMRRREDEMTIEVLTQRSKRLEEENLNLKKIADANIIPGENRETFLRRNLINHARELCELNSGNNLYEILELEQPSNKLKEQYEKLHNEFERYKLKAEAVLRSRRSEGIGISHTVSSPAFPRCPSCESSESELERLRMVIATLHEKLRNIEADQFSTKVAHDEECARMKNAISSLQSEQETVLQDLRCQMQQKVIEVENEMQKQRERTLEMLSEKEKELEVTRTILCSMRRKQLHADPADPAPGTHPERSLENRDPSDMLQRSSLNRQSFGGESYTSNADDGPLDHPSNPAKDLSGQVDSLGETTNFFYENQLLQKEKIILELRGNVQGAERSLREMQQAALTKELQYHEIIERLKDEIRLLESKIEFCSSESNMEYLRNVFVQYVQCNNPIGRKVILRAIGTVLKLNKKEMKYIEKYSF